MDPAAQNHFNARAPANRSVYQRKAYHVKMREIRALSSIHRKKEARTQQANLTHRGEGKRRERQRKRRETFSDSTPDKNLHTKKRYYRLTT